MEDSKIIDLLRKKSPETTLEIAKSLKVSWHVVQEHLLEMQIDGRIERIKVGGQNLWYLKGTKPTLMGSIGFSKIIGLSLLAMIIIIASMAVMGNYVSHVVESSNQTIASSKNISYYASLPDNKIIFKE